jgi:hypothetical protein
VLPPEERRPGDPTRVLALQEETLSLAILESEDLAVTADVELALYNSASAHVPIQCPEEFPVAMSPRPSACLISTWREQRGGREADAPCPGRSSGR